MLLGDCVKIRLREGPAWCPHPVQEVARSGAGAWPPSLGWAATWLASAAWPGHQLTPAGRRWKSPAHFVNGKEAELHQPALRSGPAPAGAASSPGRRGHLSFLSGPHTPFPTFPRAMEEAAVFLRCGPQPPGPAGDGVSAGDSGSPLTCG